MKLTELEKKIIDVIGNEHPFIDVKLVEQLYIKNKSFDLILGVIERSVKMINNSKNGTVQT